MRRLIVNADDFGFTEDVNEGIVHAFERGILRSTTLMANGAAFEHAVKLARQTPGLDVGVHLTLVDGPSLSQPGRELPATVARLLLAIRSAWGPTAIEEECCAQIEKIRAAGIEPSHVDTHKHTHLFPPVLDAVLRAAKRNGIAWVRRPFDLPLTATAANTPWKRRLVSRMLGGLSRGFDRRMRAEGLHATDAFAGFQLTGFYREPELAGLLRALPEGVTEFMCHPGFCRAPLQAARTRLKLSRVQELEALTSDLVLRAASEAQVEITSFRALCAAGERAQ
ncbi:MAG: ChbG/HpnK family deacetylase [Bryobacterales bacterium]